MSNICSIELDRSGCWVCNRCSASWVGNPPNVCLRLDITDEEIEVAALSDPDNQPLTEEDFKRMKRRESYAKGSIVE